MSFQSDLTVVWAGPYDKTFTDEQISEFFEGQHGYAPLEVWRAGASAYAGPLMEEVDDNGSRSVRRIKNTDYRAPDEDRDSGDDQE